MQYAAKKKEKSGLCVHASFIFCCCGLCVDMGSFYFLARHHTTLCKGQQPTIMRTRRLGIGLRAM